jgi:hypothetical protein
MDWRKQATFDGREFFCGPRENWPVGLPPAQLCATRDRTTKRNNNMSLLRGTRLVWRLGMLVLCFMVVVEFLVVLLLRLYGWLVVILRVVM